METEIVCFGGGVHDIAAGIQQIPEHTMYRWADDENEFVYAATSPQPDSVSL